MNKAAPTATCKGTRHEQYGSDPGDDQSMRWTAKVLRWAGGGRAHGDAPSMLWTPKEPDQNAGGFGSGSRPDRLEHSGGTWPTAGRPNNYGLDRSHFSWRPKVGIG